MNRPRGGAGKRRAGGGHRKGHVKGHDKGWHIPKRLWRRWRRNTLILAALAALAVLSVKLVQPWLLDVNPPVAQPGLE